MRLTILVIMRDERSESSNTYIIANNTVTPDLGLRLLLDLPIKRICMKYLPVRLSKKQMAQPRYLQLLFERNEIFVTPSREEISSSHHKIN
jgi:hypothetical protein